APEGEPQKKGKMVVLFDVVIRDSKMVETGLEPLMAEFSVDVGRDRILIAPNRMTNYPLQIPVTVNPRGTTGLANALKEGQQLLLGCSDVRTVRPQGPGATPPGGRYHAEVLLQDLPGGSWAETNLGADPKSLVDNLMKSDRIQELRQKISKTPNPV